MKCACPSPRHTWNWISWLRNLGKGVNKSYMSYWSYSRYNLVFKTWNILANAPVYRLDNKSELTNLSLRLLRMWRVKKGMLSDQFGPFTFVLHSHPFFIHRTDSQRYSGLAMEPRLSSEFVSNIWRDATELLLKQGIRKLVLHLRVRKVNLNQFGCKFGMISDTTDHQELVWGSYKTQTPTKQVNCHHGIAQTKGEIIATAVEYPPVPIPRIIK